MGHSYNYYLIEGGRTLELCREHIAEYRRVLELNNQICEEFGADKYVVNIFDGVISGMVFSASAPADFKKPDRKGICFPKKNSETSRRISSIKGYDRRFLKLAKALDIPQTLEYKKGDNWTGSVVAFPGFDAGVGLLWLDMDEGPFALYVYDFQKRISSLIDDGYEFEESIRNWVPDFDGANPILEEEWDLIVAKHKLAIAKEAA